MNPHILMPPFKNDFSRTHIVLERYIFLFYLLRFIVYLTGTIHTTLGQIIGKISSANLQSLSLAKLLNTMKQFRHSTQNRLKHVIKFTLNDVKMFFVLTC